MNTLIFASADINDYSFCKEYINNADYIICCDGGMRHTKALGIMPNCIMGDFDSVDSEVLEFYKSQNIQIKSFPTKKDFTDTELGLFHATEIGAKDITIIGGIGSRLDHTIANIHILVKAVDLGLNIKLVNENNTVYVAKDKMTILGAKGDLVSLLPLGESVSGVTTTGLEYPLNNDTLCVGTARGVSNVMTLAVAEIQVGSGYLMVIKSRD